MQNFDASDANFRACGGRPGVADLTANSCESAIIPLKPNGL
jgi:hypothetical protein